MGIKKMFYSGMMSEKRQIWDGYRFLDIYRENLFKLTKFALCLPGTNDVTELAFSIRSKI